MFSADDADPCEIYFSEYRDDNGRSLPGRMDMRVGDELFGTFTIEQFQLGAVKSE
jgi:hypothetical protein